MIIVIIHKQQSVHKIDSSMVQPISSTNGFHRVKTIQHTYTKYNTF